DWSSDVCSSDLGAPAPAGGGLFPSSFEEETGSSGKVSGTTVLTLSESSPSLSRTSVSSNGSSKVPSGSGFGRGLKVKVPLVLSLDSPSQPSTSTEMISPAPISP